jgi:hypothetical protein
VVALYGNDQTPTGDILFDNRLLKPKQDDGARARLRVPAGTSTVFGGTTGRRHYVDAGIVAMAPEDASHFALRTWSALDVDSAQRNDGAGHEA